MSWLFFFLYMSAFLFILRKLKLNSYRVINHNILCVIFVLKILIGISLNIIYSEYYQDRKTSDIYKYFDDSKYIHHSLKNNPLHFFQLITGINDNNPQLAIYTDSTLHWKQQSQEFSNFTQTSNVTFSNHRTITKFNAIMRIFSFGNINTHVLIMSFISLIGCLLIFKSFYQFIPSNNLKIYLVIIFLTPSIIIWSSGILKEGLLFFAFGLYFNSLFNLSKNYNRNAAILLFSFFLIFTLKYYLFIIIIPLTLLYLIPSKTNINTIAKYVVFLFFIASLFNFSENFNNQVNQMLSSKRTEQVRVAVGGYYYLQFNNKNSSRLVRFISPLKEISKIEYKSNINSKSTFFKLKPGLQYQVFNSDLNNDTLLTNSEFKYYFLDSFEKAGSYYPLPIIGKSSTNFIKSIFNAISNVFFKPFNFFEGSLLLTLASFENLLFFIFILFLLVKRKIQIANLNVLLFNLLFIFMLYTVIGLTIPVLGSLVRYKILGFLLLLISLLMIFDKKRIKNIIL